MDPHRHFQTLARYNAWATQALLAALERVPEGDYRRDCGLFFKSIHGTLNHLLLVEHRFNAPGEDHFLELAAQRIFVADQDVFRHLLRDGRAAARAVARANLGDIVDHSPGDTGVIDAAVAPAASSSLQREGWSALRPAAVRDGRRAGAGGEGGGKVPRTRWSSGASV